MEKRVLERRIRRRERLRRGEGREEKAKKILERMELLGNIEEILIN